jgi:subtilase family serine protease
MRCKPFSQFAKKLLIFSIVTIVICNTIPNSCHATDYPDLWIYSMDVSDTLIEGDSLKIPIRVQNIGTKNIPSGTDITVALLIDGNIVAVNSSNKGLNVTLLRDINLSWSITRGSQTQRTLQINVDYQNTIEELDETNNVRAKTIQVSERETDLMFTKNLFIDGSARVGAPLTIYANITNSGKNTTKQVNISLFINDVYNQTKLLEGFNKKATANISFSYTPISFGIKKITVKLDPKNTIAEQYENNNVKETNISVSLSSLQWWNSNWHYRQFYDITGIGNFSIALNFTDQLNKNLSIFGKTFETSSIQILRYFVNGTIDSRISNYSFDESTTYNAISRAKGNLTWQVTKSAYYCVYFDVVENSGTRNGIPEIPPMPKTGNPVSNFIGSAEGWWIDLEPLQTYYLPGQTLHIDITTHAQVHNATARLFKEGHYDNSVPLSSSDDVNWSGTYTFTIGQKGNWSMIVHSSDDVGYATKTEYGNFFVGYPDLSIDRINFSSDLPPSSPFYEGNHIKITGIIRAKNATVTDVNISLFINGSYANSTDHFNITKDIENKIIFNWFPIRKGTYRVTLKIDPQYEVHESNEKNNNQTKNVTIEGKPDLLFSSIYFANKTVDVGDRVEISTIIKNTGKGKAVNYHVNLYLEANKNFSMNYTSVNLKNFTNVTLDIGDSKNISLIWDPATYGSFGEWVVAVQAISNTTYPDLHPENNTFFHQTRKLYVNKPVDTPTTIQLTTIPTTERNNPVTITAHVTDASGIHNVTLFIKNPANTRYTYHLESQGNDDYVLVFTDTSVLGTYSLSILAIDASTAQNKTWKNSTFEIIEDRTPPTIEYYAAYPSVQLVGETVEISCIATDFSGIDSVTVKITYPDSHVENKTMEQESDDGKYVYSHVYDAVGKYVFIITAKDNSGLKQNTQNKSFWVTNDLNDTDSDGMPDLWEERYGFNARNPTDATEDEDGDGYTNLKEYELGTNPLKETSSLQEISKKIQDNFLYLIASCVLFVMLVVLSLYGLRRMKQ